MYHIVSCPKCEKKLNIHRRKNQTFVVKNRCEHVEEHLSRKKLALQLGYVIRSWMNKDGTKTEFLRKIRC